MRKIVQVLFLITATGDLKSNDGECRRCHDLRNVLAMTTKKGMAEDVQYLPSNTSSDRFAPCIQESVDNEDRGLSRYRTRQNRLQDGPRSRVLSLFDFAQGRLVLCKTLGAKEI